MSDRSEHEIRDSIEATRARMGETIEQIGDRVNPGRVKAEVKARAREQMHEVRDNMKRKARNTMRDVEHGVTDTGRGIWATIKDNPVPAGMVGVGLAWLFANRRDGGETRRDRETYSTGPAVPYRPGYTGYDETPRAGSTGSYGAIDRVEHGYEGEAGMREQNFSQSAATEESSSESQGIRQKASNAAHEASDRLSDAQERLGGAVHDTQERVSSAVQHTQERVSSAVHNTQERVGSLAQEAKYRAQRAERRIEDSLQENPMAIGAMALAIGMAAGLIIPESEREHELMGRGRDRVLDRAEDATRRTAGRMHDAARDAAGDSARHAVDEVWPIDGDRKTEGFTEPRR